VKDKKYRVGGRQGAVFNKISFWVKREDVRNGGASEEKIAQYGDDWKERNLERKRGWMTKPHMVVVSFAVWQMKSDRRLVLRNRLRCRDKLKMKRGGAKVSRGGWGAGTLAQRTGKRSGGCGGGSFLCGCGVVGIAE